MKNTSRSIVPFTFLRAHSYYSIGWGCESPESLCAAAARAGYDAIALTDNLSTHGFVEFHHAAREHEIKPIYGVTIPVEHADLVLLAIDAAGLERICALTSRVLSDATTDPLAPDEGGARPGIVAILSPRPGTEIPAALYTRVRLSFGDAALQGISSSQSVPESGPLPAVLAPPVRWTDQEGARLFESLAPLREGDTDVVAGGELPQLKKVAPAVDRFGDAYRRTARIAARVEGDLLASFFEDTASNLFDPRSEDIAWLDQIASDHRDDRVGNECNAIREAGATRLLRNHFLLLQRLREAGVRVGPATGMGVQSRIARKIGITQFDPYERDERFHYVPPRDLRTHNAIDLQIAPADRPHALAVIGKVFRAGHLSYVPVVDHFGASAAVKLAAETVNVPKGGLEKITRIIGRHSGTPLVTLVNENRALGALVRRDAKLRKLLQVAADIEGLPHSVVRSKRSLVVSERPLRHVFAMVTDSETGESFVQAPREAFPNQRVLRIDITTSTAVSVCYELSGKATPAWEPETEGLSALADPDLTGVYMFESSYTRRLVSSFGIDSFDRLVVFLAVMRYRRGDLTFAQRLSEVGHRPDPHANAPSRRRRTHPEGGGSAEDDELAFIARETAGYLVFRDQVRDAWSALTAQDRRAATRDIEQLASHDPATLAELRSRYMRAAAESDIPQSDAQRWYQRMLFAADRAVDRQPVIAEALITTHLLRARVQDRAAFAAAWLNAVSDARSTRIAAAYADLLEPADINYSDATEYRVVEGKVWAPLSSLGGISDPVAKAIRRIRGRGRFHSLEDFLNRISQDVVNMSDTRHLVKSGAFHRIDPGATTRDLRGRSPRRGATRVSSSRQLVLFAEPARTDHPKSSQLQKPQKDRNPGMGLSVLETLPEFYPHQDGTPVQLSGRVRDLQVLEGPSGGQAWVMELHDSVGVVRVLVLDPLLTKSAPPTAGDVVSVNGVVATRSGSKVCVATHAPVASDANGDTAGEGGNAQDGKATPDQPSAGDP